MTSTDESFKAILVVILLPVVIYTKCVHATKSERSWFVVPEGTDTIGCGESTIHPCKTIRYTVSKSSSNDLIVLKASRGSAFNHECGRTAEDAIVVKHSIIIEGESTAGFPATIDCQDGYGLLLNSQLTLKNVVIKNAYVVIVHNTGVLTLENVTIRDSHYGIACPALLRPDAISGNSSVYVRASKSHFLNNTRSISTLENSVACADVLDVSFQWCVFHSSPFVLFARETSRIFSAHSVYSGTINLSTQTKPHPLQIYTSAKKIDILFVGDSFDGFPSSDLTASLLWISLFADGDLPRREINMSFVDVVFQNSHSSSWSPIMLGGGCEWNSARIIFQNCTFRNNTGLLAGAVRVPSDMHCTIHFNQCTFENNSATTVGGAIKIGRNSWVSITNSRFSNQSSVDAGGTIYTEGSLELVNTTFASSFVNDAIQGDIFYGTGDIELLGNVSFFANRAVDDSAVFWSDFSSIKVRGRLYILCPEERVLLELKTLPLDPKAQVYQQSNYSMLAYYCRSCKTGQYTFDQATVDTAGVSVQGRCHLCPFGGACLKGHIAATPGFWGFKARAGTVSFASCPAGYCCSDKKECRDYNSCGATRRGTLCGQCLSGYSETLLSPKCKPDAECHDVWVWFLALILVLAFVMFLVYSDEIESFVFRQVFWWKTEIETSFEDIKQFTNSEMEDLSQTGEITLVRSQPTNNGYQIIIFYYYQAASFLRVRPVFRDYSQQATPLNSLLALFKLQPFFLGPSSGYVCPVTGLTALGKILILGFSTVLPPVILLGFIYVIFRAVDWYRTRRASLSSAEAGQVRSLLTQDDEDSPPLTLNHPGHSSLAQDYRVRCKKTILNLFLLSYASMASMTFTLLHCVQVGDSRVLFKAGYVTCYQPWQYLFMIYAALCIFPLWLVVAVAPYAVRAGVGTVKEMICACVLPLPVLILWLTKWLRKRFYGFEFQPIAEQQSVIQLSFISIIDGPFLVKSGGKGLGPVYWHGIFTARRLVLATVNIFVQDPAVKFLCLTLVCLFCLIHHIWTMPFNSRPANNLEIASLTSLTILALMNLITGVLNSGGYEVGQGGQLERLVEATKWWESVVLWFPLVLLVLFVLISQLIRLVVAAVRLCLQCVRV